MDTQNQGTRNSRHKTVELGCAAVYMSPNFAHTIGRITGYLRFVPKESPTVSKCQKRRSDLVSSPDTEANRIQIIRIAEGINHAIPTTKELSEALKNTTI